jgi:hypothetical protein
MGKLGDARAPPRSLTHQDAFISSAWRESLREWLCQALVNSEALESRVRVTSGGDPSYFPLQKVDVSQAICWPRF